MDNLNTPDNMSKNTHTKLFKLQFSGASGNNTEWLTSARKPLETKGFRAFYVLMKMLLQHFCNAQVKKHKKEYKNGLITISNHVFYWDYLAVLKAVATSYTAPVSLLTCIRLTMAVLWFRAASNTFISSLPPAVGMR